MKQDTLNRFITAIIPRLPLWTVSIIARRYVAGIKQQDALQIVRVLNDKGFSVTIDILGEHSKNMELSQSFTEQYINLYESIQSSKLDCNISIKPTHLGLDISKECVWENLLSLLTIAKKNNNFLRIDMEDSSVIDDTIELYQKCKVHYPEVGMVLQAYLYRSKDDLDSLCKGSNINLRICKGIYREHPDIAIQDRQKINDNYISLLKYAWEKNIYVAIATHDLELIETAYQLINDLNISSDQFEFQVLYGVPMSGWLQKHLKNGYKVRIYLPFGKDWYDYSLRRLKENPNIAGYILNNIFRK